MIHLQEPCTPETQRDIRRLSEQLNSCNDEWLAARAETHGPETLEGAPYRELSYQQTLERLITDFSTSPAGLVAEYQELIIEGHIDPLGEVIQGFREELLVYLLDKTIFVPEELTKLQDTYLSALAAREVAHALRCG